MVRIDIYIGDFSNEEKPKRVIYAGYSSHDCELHWKCPYCKKDYGSWYLWNKGIKPDEVVNCEKCNKKIIFWSK